MDDKKNSSYNELVCMEREKRTFTILQRERELNQTAFKKHKAATLAGTCILATIISTFFNGLDSNVVLHHELQSLYSWEALKEFFNDMGPLTTFFSICSATFVSRYLKYSKRYHQLKEQFLDFSASLENGYNVGGNKNDRTR